MCGSVVELYTPPGVCGIIGIPWTFSGTQTQQCWAFRCGSKAEMYAGALWRSRVRRHGSGPASSLSGVMHPATQTKKNGARESVTAQVLGSGGAPQRRTAPARMNADGADSVLMGPGGEELECAPARVMQLDELATSSAAAEEHGLHRRMQVLWGGCSIEMPLLLARTGLAAGLAGAT